MLTLFSESPINSDIKCAIKNIRTPFNNRLKQAEKELAKNANNCKL